MDKMRILVVDDNIVNLAALEQDLKDTYEVIPVSSGRRAIKFLYVEQVDLILMDVQMPLMDGIETLREIRSLDNGVTIPVIFLTAVKDKATVVEGSKLGIMDYIVKPFNSEDLHERIERALRRHGTLPMESSEVYQRISRVRDSIKEGKIKAAITQTEEILFYQIDKSVSGRMQVVRNKLTGNNIEGAQRTVERVLKLIEKQEDSISSTATSSINMGEINSRLLFIQKEIGDFNTEEAIEKIEELKHYEIPSYVLSALIKIQERLQAFDDDDAEQLINSTLEKLKKDWK